MIIREINSVPLDKCPALVLNADYRPLISSFCRAPSRRI